MFRPVQLHVHEWYKSNWTKQILPIVNVNATTEGWTNKNQDERDKFYKELEKTVKERKAIKTHGGRVTHICGSKITIISSDNGLSPGRRQAIIWTSAGITLIGPLGINFSEILIEIYIFSFKKMHLKMSSGNCQPFCPWLNVLLAGDLNAAVGKK